MDVRYGLCRNPLFNTPEDEMAPFLYFDNRTLFFASDGYPGMGKRIFIKWTWM